MLKGIGVSDGIGIGKVFLIEENSLEYMSKSVTDTKEEIQRFKNAVEQFCMDTKRKAEALKISVGENEAKILLSHISIIEDPYLTDKVEKLIEAGQCAESAFESICDMFISVFSGKDDEITIQRAADVHDVKVGVLNILLGISSVKIGDAPSGTVLVSKELTPSMTAEINKNNIVGIITETGSTTSHSAILARALEIPAVMSVQNITDIVKKGNSVIIDGDKGDVIISPDKKQLESYEQKRENLILEHKELEKFRGKATLSADGEKFKLLCNIGNPEDAVKSMKCDGEGVGLFRTEFLFMNKAALPTEEEQFEAYKKAALILKGKPLIIRTLDIGGDKDISYLELEKEENPFMGFRAIRYCLKKRELFKTQLRAIVRASVFGDVRIMLPFVTCIEEIRESKRLIKEIKTELRAERIDFDENIKVGIMIETAAAVIISDILAKESDFFSIGTNDLTGYTMACDRGNSNVSYLYSPFQPSVLRMIKHIIECGRENNIPVGMCGESAANPMMIPLLMSFGLTEFSVSAPSVLKVRKCISSLTKQKADEIAQKAMNFDTKQKIYEYLKSETALLLEN